VPVTDPAARGATAAGPSPAGQGRAAGTSLDRSGVAVGVRPTAPAAATARGIAAAPGGARRADAGQVGEYTDDAAGIGGGHAATTAPPALPPPPSYDRRLTPAEAAYVAAWARSRVEKR
jgi:hypothetical protein